ncbi:MAG: DhaKLM operon coactivator DhaQ [Alkalibacterium sp.]|uniref:Dihydroxyacetone kinase n=1 Tax=Alkalibacterium gilvum TaxID=1130080 RepID=A0A1H6SWR6_9LACT|nr:dihydroxyacetone kinase subunit DhaK [Alkalibacterium gilvum]MDN6385170.1 DhaKLM operon coactivator DhaQ [Alkalibacterium sp.]MDN6730203.1 DhaKLM operon coactivator DhaQ [Alkalibacterium sp.]SEI71336.1 dihydroxyacetone kinase [Alkalibacterium gilvum]
MKHIQNNPNQSIDFMLTGFHFEHKERIDYDSTNKIIYQKNQDQVSVISGGGSGHEPAHFGYVGKNMLTASVNGELFIPPEPKAILEAIKKTDNGKGALLIVKNFARDMASFTEAKEKAIKLGHKTDIVCVADDHSIEDTHTFKKRHRGVAGTLFVHKIVGAFAEKGMSLKDLKKLGDDVSANLYTLGVALSPARTPENEHATFDLLEGEVYYGIGIHGEKGYRKVPYHSSEQLAIELVNKLKRLIDWTPEDTFAVLINGLGSTTLMEQYIFTNDIRRLLNLEQIDTSFVKVGSHLTSYNMHGISLTLLKVNDLKWIDALKEETNASHW